MANRLEIHEQLVGKEVLCLCPEGDFTAKVVAVLDEDFFLVYDGQGERMVNVFDMRNLRGLDFGFK